MREESKKTVGVAELVEFGKHLNDLHGADRTFEVADASGRMEVCSLDDVIASFQTYFDGKSESFKVCITFSDQQAGVIGHKTTEFQKVSDQTQTKKGTK